jgi:hypothetical protein
VYSPTGLVPLPSHLTCTPTKSILYLASSLETVIREPALYKLLTFHNPNLISIFRSLGRLSKESVQVRGLCKLFVTSFSYGEGLLTPSWRATPCYLSAAAYSIYSQLTSIAGGRSSIRNPRTRHAVGTGIPPIYTHTIYIYIYIYIYKCTGLGKKIYNIFQVIKLKKLNFVA